MAVDSDPRRIFGKTDAGRQALATRERTAMTVKARMALVIINGRDDLRALRVSLGPDADATINELLRAGLIAPLTSPAVPAPLTASAPLTVHAPLTPIPNPQPEPAPRQAADSQEKLFALQRQALACLRPHFGPDVVMIAQPLVSAVTLQEFAAGLDPIERQLAVYVGKKQAARILAPLRNLEKPG